MTFKSRADTLRARRPAGHELINGAAFPAVG
jgi:hypothetical protein